MTMVAEGSTIEGRRPRLVLIPALSALCIASVLAVCCNRGMAAAPGGGNSSIYPLAHADAETVGPQLQGLLNDYGAEAQVVFDRSKNQLVVQGAEASRQLAGQLIATLDKAPNQPAATAELGKVAGYAIDPDRLDATAAALQQRFPPSTGVRVAPDRRTSQLVVIAPPTMQTQVAAFLQADAVTPAAAGGTRLDPYRLQNISWRDFEASLVRLWGNGLVITPDASGRLATVHLASDPARQAVLQIDRQTHEVLFPGAADASRSWRQVTAALDRSPTARGMTTQLVPLRRADPAQVQQAVSMIRDAALRTQSGETLAAVPVSQPGKPRSAVNLVSMIFQDAREAAPAAPAPAQEAQEAQEEEREEEMSPEQAPGAELQPSPDQPSLPGEPGAGQGAESDGLLGDVQIEFVPELGVVILRGNRRDVEKIQKIIADIEEKSEATRPEIRLVTLEHTNSESMTTLVTSIYSEVYQPRQGPLTITALVKPNAILMIGRLENIKTVVNLIEKLDQPVPPESQIKVFRLLHMSAVNAETYIRNFYGAAGGVAGVAVGAQQAQQTARGLSPRITVIGDYRSNSLIVQASPRDLLEVGKLLEELDVAKTEASIEVRVFPLKNSVASALTQVLQSTLAMQQMQGTAGMQGFQPMQMMAQGQQQTAVSKSIQIVGIDQEGNKIIESGLLNDVTVTADDNSNTVVVKAPAESMGLIAALIEQLDKIPAAESLIKVFQIKNGDATNLTAMLQTLFGQQVTAGQVGVFSQTVGRTFGMQGPLQQVSAGESSLIPLNFGVDARTNSIVASGSAADLAVVEAILMRLDEGDLRQRKLIVYRLNNAPAQYVADALTTILNEQYQLLSQQQSQQYSLISQFEIIDQQISVVPEVISNTLIVSATPKYYEQITEVIEDLDRRPPMIMIQVVVCLVRLDDSEEMGVELGLQDSLLFDRSATASGLLDPGFNFANQPLGNASSAGSLATRGKLAGQAFGSFAVGRSSAAEGFPGLVLSAANESINILIRALVKKSRVQVLSRPQIMTLNNVPASVLIGQRIPQITDFQTTTAGNTVNSVELVDTGVSLGVIPRVTPDGLIIMDLEANDSKAGDPADGITIGVQDGVPIQSPIYDDVTAITTIAARSGQTVVFGGLITSERTDTFRGVPYLSDIPVLGHLFRFDTKSDGRQELLFFLTPHIVMDDDDVRTLNQREADRMSWCLADVVQIHGDPGFGASRIDTWNEGTPLIYPSVDPTAEGAIPMDGSEAVPMPPGQPIMEYSAPGATGKPFVLPPDQRQEGKPFILPPAERQEGKPFVLPEGELPQGRPFIEGQNQSLRQPPAGPLDLQPANAWRAPPAQEPYQTDATPTPATVIPAAASELAGGQEPAPLSNMPLSNMPPAPSASQRPYSQFPYVK